MTDYLIHITALASMACLAIQIAYDSVLAQRLKQVFFLEDNALERLILPIKQQHPLLVILLIPIMVLITIYVKVNLYVKELFDCPYCISFWLGVMAGLVLGYDLKITLLYAPLTIGFVYLYEKLIK